ncbi:MAG: peptidyl-prolyl cis-trans isomerase, partial [Proteobacteria bacterium]|nr:peptidyl-prolyl cis-trans isomerase [Pseudomonadota bacterium]
FSTSKGNIVTELYPDKAPITVENFLQYVKDGFFRGTVFHRVIPGFVIQGGGLMPNMNRKPTRPPIKNEAGNGLDNHRGTLSMARTSDVDSATSQFFINLADNASLDHRDDSAQGFGYAVFGKVAEGMDVVDAIAATPTGNKAGHQDVPKTDIVVRDAKVQ